MTYPLTLIVQWTPEQRQTFHRVLADWTGTASDEEFIQLESLKEQVAPGQICSLLTLVRRCFARQALLDQLPAALVERLQGANLPLACVAA